MFLARDNLVHRGSTTEVNLQWGGDSSPERLIPVAGPPSATCARAPETLTGALKQGLRPTGEEG